MTPEQLHCYTEEVWLHAKIALREFDQLEALLNNPMTRQHREVWVVLQAFLTHAGMVSKLLSPPSSAPVSRHRGRILSQHLNVAASSPILNRDARNAIEHLDERMDNWLKGGHSGFLESVFQNRNEMNYLALSQWCVRRVLLLDEMVFVTQGKNNREETELLPLRDELCRIITECEARFNSSDPYSYIFP